MRNAASLLNNPDLPTSSFSMALSTDREKCAHLLRRFGLGASEAELDYYLKDGFKGAIDKLLNYENVDEGFTLDVNSFRSAKNQNLNPQAVAIWWTARMLVTTRPLQEKMTLFWHDHFATSGSKVNAGAMMVAQNEILRANATGRFEKMLLQVSQDPAMLFWLDNQYNVKGKPNENFAREVMELFTLGIGNYTETDIKEAARAFTGWSIRRTTVSQGDQKRGQSEYFFRPFQHDSGTKTVLGKTGELNGEDVIAHLCELPRTAEYLTNKIWEWFAYPGPDKDLVGRLADVYRRSNLDTKVLLRSIMESPEFYSEKAERATWKNPVDFVVVTLRQLGVGQVLQQMIGNGSDEQAPGRLGPAASSYQAMKQMGMQLLYPPDVAGWDGGAAWVSTATMVERISWAEKLFGRAAGRFGARFGVAQLFAEDPSPSGIAKKLVSIFDAPSSPAMLAKLTEAASSSMNGRLTPQNAGATAAAVSRLIFASPTFQFS